METLEILARWIVWMDNEYVSLDDPPETTIDGLSWDMVVIMAKELLADNVLQPTQEGAAD